MFIMANTFKPTLVHFDYRLRYRYRTNMMTIIVLNFRGSISESTVSIFKPRPKAEE